MPRDGLRLFFNLWAWGEFEYVYLQRNGLRTKAILMDSQNGAQGILQKIQEHDESKLFIYIVFLG